MLADLSADSPYDGWDVDRSSGGPLVQLGRVTRKAGKRERESGGQEHGEWPIPPPKRLR